MKRFLRNAGIVAIVCVLVQCAFFAVSAKGDIYKGAEGEVVMTIGEKDTYVNGALIENDVAPVIANGRTMLPARFVAENLGADVTWYEPQRKVIIRKDTTKIELVVDSRTAYVNGRTVMLDSPVFIDKGRTYTPVRFIVESLGATVDWLADTEQVVIYPDISIQDVITEFYKEKADSIWESLGKKGNAFLADLDGDNNPELCFNLGKNTGGVKVYKYKSGSVVDTKNDVASEYGTGIKSSFDFILEENGDILIWSENKTQFVYDKTQNFEFYHEYTWSDKGPQYSYRLEISQSGGNYKCSENGKSQRSISNTEKASLIKTVESRYRGYGDAIIDVDACGFTEIWEEQQKLVESYNVDDDIVLDQLYITNLHYDYEAGSFNAGFFKGAIGTEELIYYINGPQNVKKVIIADYRETEYSQREVYKIAKETANKMLEDGVSLETSKMPYGVGGTIPVYTETLRKDMYVLIVGIDENYTPVAYSIVEVFLG